MKTRNSRSTTWGFRPQVECLEDRSLPSVTVHLTPEGVLKVMGTATGDRLRVSETPEMVSVFANRVADSTTVPLRFVAGFAVQDVGQVHVDCLEGNDEVTLALPTLGATVLAGPGNDTVIGGNGDDNLFGSTGDDSLFGSLGSDRLYGERGNDGLDGGDGDDDIYGGDGADLITGGNGDDWLVGQAGADSMDGGAGGDRMHGDDGNDTMRGGAGDDTMEGGDHSDTLLGEAGNDTLAGHGIQNRNSAFVDNLDGGLGQNTAYVPDDMAFVIFANIQQLKK